MGTIFIKPAHLTLDGDVYYMPALLTYQGDISHNAFCELIQSDYFDEIGGTGWMRLMPVNKATINKDFASLCGGYDKEGHVYREYDDIDDTTTFTVLYAFTVTEDMTLEEEVDAINTELAEYKKRFNANFVALPTEGNNYQLYGNKDKIFIYVCIHESGVGHCFAESTLPNAIAVSVSNDELHEIEPI